MPRKMTTEEFITKARLVHGDKFGYGRVEYKTAWEKVIITCQVHGDFLQAPANHLFGAKCLRCRQERTGKANSISQDEFITKSQQIHGLRYDYSKVRYTGIFVPVEIICQKHGSFSQKPYSHLNFHRSPTGCPKCGRERTSSFHRKSTEDFIKDAIEVHGNFYDYSQVEYKNSHIKIIIICLVHGAFEQKAYTHLNGAGCPKCGKLSRGEERISIFLESNHIDFEREKWFDECRHKNPLPFDFYFMLSNKRFLIEYDGSQHVNGWGGKETLARIQRNDSIKTAYAASNGFHLIRIPYTDFDNIETILKTEIQKHA